jgi:hypothetical protein
MKARRQVIGISEGNGRGFFSALTFFNLGLAQKGLFFVAEGFTSEIVIQGLPKGLSKGLIQESEFCLRAYSILLSICFSFPGSLSSVKPGSIIYYYLLVDSIMVLESSM